MTEFLHVITPVLTACIGAIPALIVAFNTNKLIAYRVDELSKKVDKHNQLVERTFKLESDIKTIQVQQNEMKDDVDEIKNTIQSMQ